MLKIMLGFDGSQPGWTAIDVAADLIPEAHAVLAHFWSSPIVDPEVRNRLTARAKDLDELTELAEQEGAERAEKLAGEAVTRAQAAGWHAEPLARRYFGGAGFELARAAEDAEADLVVVGARGLGGVKAVLGSTSDLLVHVSTVPVLVVPQQPEDAKSDAAKAGPVLVGYDGSEGSRKALAAAASILAGRNFVVATVRDADADVVQRDTLNLEGIGDADVIVLEPEGGGTRSVATALSRCADERDASVIAVGSRGRSAAREILLGSAAMGVLHKAKKPVLVVPSRRFE